MKIKTHKALSKRLTITKNKKVLKRRAGQDHFNSRDTGEQTMRKRRDVAFSSAHKKAIQDLIPGF